MVGIPCILQRLFTKKGIPFLKACLTTILYDLFTIVAMVLFSMDMENTFGYGVVAVLITDLFGAAILSIRRRQRNKITQPMPQKHKRSFSDEMIYGNPVQPWRHTIREANPWDMDSQDIFSKRKK